MTDSSSVERVRTAFSEAFGGAPDFLVQAPGRVNLIGEHTDYNDGFVLPVAINFGTTVAARRRPDTIVATLAADLGGESDRFRLDAPIAPTGSWRDYVRGVAVMLTSAGLERGADLAISGNVPRGAGLSSSASLEVAVAEALARLEGLALDRTQIARLAQRAENEFVGCACGIMDQLASARARAGHALLIDCRSLECRDVPLPSDLAIVVIDSRVSRSLVDSAYNERRNQCALAARHYSVATLRDLNVETLEADEAGLDPLLFRRARHVVTENQRTLAAAEALAVGDLARLGALMADSHQSMRDDFEITVPPIDRLVEIAAGAIGQQGGARMTGGGFGGCVVALAPKAAVSEIREKVGRDYRSPDGTPAMVMICEAAGGVGLVESSLY